MANERALAETLQYSSKEQPFVSFTDTSEIFYYYPAVEVVGSTFYETVNVEECTLCVATCYTEHS
jgi:hypothetical protein